MSSLDFKRANQLRTRLYPEADKQEEDRKLRLKTHTQDTTGPGDRVDSMHLSESCERIHG